MPLTRKVPKREFKSTRTGTPLSQPSLQWTRLMPGVPSGNRTAQGRVPAKPQALGPQGEGLPLHGPVDAVHLHGGPLRDVSPFMARCRGLGAFGVRAEGLVPGWLSSAIHRIKMRTPTNGTRDRNTHAPLRPVS